MSDVLLYLVKTNSATTYFKESAVLPQFWAALPLADGNQIDNLDFSTTELFKVYHNNVGQSIYEDYLPVISHFFEHPCNRIAVENLMTPDLPSLLPTPRHMSKAMAERVRLANRQGKNGAGKNCIIFSLACRQVIALDEDGNIAKDIPVCLLTSGLGRIENNMVSRARKVSPATNSSSSSILSLHWWSLSSRPSIPCSPLHVGIYVKRLGDHWEDHIHCVEAGVIPDIDGIDASKGYLQVRLRDSGAEGHHGGSDSVVHDVSFNQGRIAPRSRLCAILANASGPFSTVIPEIRRYAGPDVSGPYNLYKVVGSDDVIEFLPVGEPEESKYLAQSWNV
ncbi:hypothetical protein BKA82DRAFT_4448546 [Pisolithus tinctorius]|nr:hypothetical protein BKA82DRAFT_4448546 [Pisolithus tinctorius]